MSIDEARKGILAILAQLEIDMERTVENIEVVTVDVTRLQDDSPRIAKDIRISFGSIKRWAPY